MAGIGKVFRKFPGTFWTANGMELFERASWYGFYMLLANYLTKSTDIGALGFTQVEKSLIMGVGTAILYLLPVITGAIADRYGYKKVLAIAFTVYIAGFVMFPFCKSFGAVFATYLVLAVGGALFKPIITATVSKTTDDETSSVGFGIYYMMVNVGAFIGPLVALHFSKISYDMVFYISAGVMALNYGLLFLFKEPGREKINTSFGYSMQKVVRDIGTALSDIKFVVFLILVAGFWSMYYQLFYTMPVFIEQWVDTKLLYNFLSENMSWLAGIVGSPDGTIKSEYFTTLDSMYIIFFQIIISGAVMKWKPLNAMMTGFLVCSIGLGLTLYTNNPFFIVGAILIFGIGEMAGSPKITEYVGKIAPKDKVALYMGCGFLPVAGGSLLAGYLSGGVYESMSDKIAIVGKELAKRGLEIPKISETFSKTDYLNRAGELMNMNQSELTSYLWTAYSPQNIWIVLFGVGVVSVLGLLLYDRLWISRKR